MVGAVIINDIVQTLIVINPEQVEEMQLALNAEIVDARPYGLAVGDLRTAAGWTRNAGGEQIVLPLLEPEQYDSYSVAMTRVAEMEQAQEDIAQAAADEAAAEAIAILTGEVEE